MNKTEISQKSAENAPRHFENPRHLSRHFELTPQQQAAYDQLLPFCAGETDAGMATLEGYAGTGKTTLVGLMIRELLGDDENRDIVSVITGLRIAVAAPTNKAVRVLRDALVAADVDAEQVTFGSIHSFLGLQLKEREDGSQECVPAGHANLHVYDLVIIDECSMIAQDMMTMIANSRRSARVLFIGDPAQLPPISSSQPSPVFTHVNLRCVLTDVVRQARDNPIIRLSMTIRDHIEAGADIPAVTLAESLPVTYPAQAGIVGGGMGTAVAIAVDEIQSGRDARVIAYTNNQVLAYNRMIHHALHGDTICPFVPGEPVVAHSQFEARDWDIEHSTPGRPRIIITSEELEVISAESMPHPLYAEVPAHRIVLQQDDGNYVCSYVADDQTQLNQAINRLFDQWRQAKAEKNPEARSYSGQAWGLRKAFAPLRHAYAITTHKSQGSTFDVVVVDFDDLAKMRSVFDRNRALYVACTRSRELLALVVG